MANWLPLALAAFSTSDWRPLTTHYYARHIKRRNDNYDKEQNSKPLHNLLGMLAPRRVTPAAAMMSVVMMLVRNLWC